MSPTFAANDWTTPYWREGQRLHPKRGFGHKTSSTSSNNPLSGGEGFYFGLARVSSTPLNAVGFTTWYWHPLPPVSSNHRVADCDEIQFPRTDRMDIHKNARLTLRSRELLVEIVKGGLGFSRSAASFHVTPKTAAKWVRRYQSEGAVGLRRVANISGR